MLEAGADIPYKGRIFHELELQKQAEERRQFLSQMLQSHVVVNASYDAQGKQPCDPDTRNDVLAEIRAWIYDISMTAQSFVWLTGDPGSGKSAITASIAKEYQDAEILWAQLFINRNNDETTDPKSIFPSIAHQLAKFSPAVAAIIHDALKHKPSLVTDISSEQAAGLFINAVTAASAVDPTKPVLVVIDGLDEINHDRLSDTANILSELFSKVHGNVKVFIASRTEDDIRKPFTKVATGNNVKRIHLDTSAQSSIVDVSNFLRRKIVNIVIDNDLDWEKWPGEQRMDSLCTRASGLFIWAVTVAKFLHEQIRAEGTECLDVVLDLLNTDGMGDINVLYGTILQLTIGESTERSNSWAFERFRRIIGCIVVLREPLRVDDLQSLLDLRQTSSSSPVDIKNFVRRLRTVLVAGTAAVDGYTVPRLHKSFFEFITSERASPQWRVSPAVSNGEIAVQCLRQLVTFYGNRAAYDIASGMSSKTDSTLSGQLRYAIRFWSTHLQQSRELSSGLAFINVSSFQASDLQNRFKLGENNYPQTILNISLSTDTQRVLRSRDTIVGVWDGLNGHLVKGTPDWAIAGHTDGVNCVAFSPNGKQIASGSRDNTVRIWDVYSGQPYLHPFVGHRRWVRSVAFSPDGKHIVSGSMDNTVRVWNVRGGNLHLPPFEGHRGGIWCVVFSPSGKQIASASDDDTIRVWDALNGKQYLHPFEGHTASVKSVVFSPDGMQIASASDDGTIRIWDIQSGQLYLPPVEANQGRVWSLAFSPNGKQIVSGGDDGTVRVWDAQDGQRCIVSFKGHGSRVRVVVFSPDGKQIASSSEDRTIRLWHIESGKLCLPPFEGHRGWVWSVAFSPNGKQIVSGGDDKTVRIWNSITGKPVQRSAGPKYILWVSSTSSPNQKHIQHTSTGYSLQIFDMLSHEPTGLFLEGDVQGAISTVSSPDGSRIAAFSVDGGIFLWNAQTYKLVIPPLKKDIRCHAFLSFSTDGKRLICTFIDGTIYVLNATDGTHAAKLSRPSDTFPSGSTGSLFNLMKGWGCADESEALLQWLPSTDPNYGIWAYIDGTIIRSNGQESVSIVDVSNLQAM